jgi:hypothetical protein
MAKKLDTGFSRDLTLRLLEVSKAADQIHSDADVLDLNTFDIVILAMNMADARREHDAIAAGDASRISVYRDAIEMMLSTMKECLVDGGWLTSERMQLVKAVATEVQRYNDVMHRYKYHPEWRDEVKLRAPRCKDDVKALARVYVSYPGRLEREMAEAFAEAQAEAQTKE